MSGRLPWFKMYGRDARTSPKLDALNDREFRLWHKLLCLASDGDPRGTVDLVDLDFVALELRVGVAELDSAISRMVQVRLVTRSDERLRFDSFDARQAVRPSSRPEAARARQQKRRAGSPAETGVSRDVTRLSRAVTRVSRVGHATEEEVDAEKKQGVQGENVCADGTPVPLAELLADARLRLAGGGR